MAIISKSVMNRIKKHAEDQGATVTAHRSGSGIRIKTAEGKVLIVHGTPGRPEVYLLSLRDDFRRVGLTPPEKW